MMRNAPIHYAIIRDRATDPDPLLEQKFLEEGYGETNCVSAKNCFSSWLLLLLVKSGPRLRKFLTKGLVN
jgi:hypothetical protein